MINSNGLTMQVPTPPSGSDPRGELLALYRALENAAAALRQAARIPALDRVPESRALIEFAAERAAVALDDYDAVRDRTP